MQPEQVRFSTHPRPFRVLAAQCVNLACACSEVTFDLVAVVEAGTPASVRLRLRFRVDPETWQEVQAPERSAALAALVQEFLRDYPEAERLAFQQAARQKQQMARQLRECRFDAEALAGDRLVSFAEIVSESDTTGPVAFLGRLDHDGRTYLIRDLYCANPQCACSQVHLEFLSYTPPSAPGGKAVAKPHLLACVSLTGDVRVEQALVGTNAQAAVLLAAWWPDHREVLGDLKWRYGKIKEIGRRSMPIGKLLATDAPMTREPRLSEGRPGRNDPCPCGSGKKYKKCCGR